MRDIDRKIMKPFYNLFAAPGLQMEPGKIWQINSYLRMQPCFGQINWWHLDTFFPQSLRWLEPSISRTLSEHHTAWTNLASDIIALNMNLWLKFFVVDKVFKLISDLFPTLDLVNTAC